MQTTNELPPDAIDAARAAEILGGSRSRIYRMLDDGRLRGWRVGGTQVRVSESEVRALIQPVTPREATGMRGPAQEQAAGAACMERLRKAGYVG